MPYTFFTEAQKRQANEVDLAAFLTSQGEKLIPSGRDFRLDSDHSVTIRGNRVLLPEHKDWNEDLVAAVREQEEGLVMVT